MTDDEAPTAQSIWTREIEVPAGLTRLWRLTVRIAVFLQVVFLIVCLAALTWIFSQYLPVDQGDRVRLGGGVSVVVPAGYGGTLTSVEDTSQSFKRHVSLSNPPESRAMWRADRLVVGVISTSEGVDRWSRLDRRYASNVATGLPASSMATVNLADDWTAVVTLRYEWRHWEWPVQEVFATISNPGHRSVRVEEFRELSAAPSVTPPPAAEFSRVADDLQLRLP